MSDGDSDHVRKIQMIFAMVGIKIVNILQGSDLFYHVVDIVCFHMNIICRYNLFV